MKPRFKIEWHDTYTNEDRQIEVHTRRAVGDVLETLRRKDWRHKDIKLTERRPTWIREYVILLES